MSEKYKASTNKGN